MLKYLQQHFLPQDEKIRRQRPPCRNPLLDLRFATINKNLKDRGYASHDPI